MSSASELVSLQVELCWVRGEAELKAGRFRPGLVFDKIGLNTMPELTVFKGTDSLASVDTGAGIEGGCAVFAGHCALLLFVYMRPPAGAEQ